MIVRSDPSEYYSKLSGFFYMLEKRNEKSYTEIKKKTNAEYEFKCKFMAIRASINGRVLIIGDTYDSIRWSIP